MNRSEGTNRFGGSVPLWIPAVAGLLLATPFALLELANRRGFDEEFPLALFVLLWALPTALIALTVSTVQALRSGQVRSGSVILRVVVLAMLAWFWIAILTDQMPCFLGAPSCD